MSKPEYSKIKFRDPVVRRVVEKFVDRSDTGFKKYGRTLHSERLGGHKDLVGYLNDIQEELMDAVNYIEKAKAVLTDEIEEVALKRFSGADDIGVHEEEIL